jgi:Fe-S-cluster containining protein
MALKRPFECQRCGRCCTRLGLPWPRILSKLGEMAEFLKINEEDLVTRYYGDVVTMNGKRVLRFDRKRTTPCPFLGDRTCTIYPVRPVECGTYPFDVWNSFDSRIESGQSSIFDSFVGMDCPELEDTP